MTSILAGPPAQPSRTAAFPSSSAVEAAIAAYRNGLPVIVVDDEDRENEGDLTLPAQFVTAPAINMMARLARGLVCISLTAARLDELGIPPMVKTNSSTFATPFTISVDAAEGTTTGVSAPDRARTVEALLNPATRPDQLAMPGHLFPLRARDGGVFERRGQTEAVIDLCRLSGLYPGAVLTEIMAPDGTMARMPRLRRLARRLRCPVVSVEQIHAYRMRRERVVERLAETIIPSPRGAWRTVAYASKLDRDELVAFVLGPVQAAAPMNVSVHRQDVVAEVLQGALQPLLKRLERLGRGVVLYRLPAPASAPRPPVLGAAERQVLHDLGVTNYRLLRPEEIEDDTLSPFHYAQMEADDWC